MQTLSNTTPTTKKESVYTRQIAFFCAFLLPASKLLEVPSLLAKYAKGDLLVPAILHFVLQAAILFTLLFAISKSEQSLFDRLFSAIGKWTYLFLGIYALYYVFYLIEPLLDLEKFTYSAFSDTEPTFFSFAFFFFLSAFICTKGIKAIGRCADLCLFLFLFPFLALIAMSLVETDFSHLLPFFGTPFGDTVYAFSYTTPHFSDVALVLPLLLFYRHKKGDTAKIMTGYGVGAGFTLLLLSVFFGIYSSLAAREHYAFSKIAQYFPALSVLGRIDLIFVYLLSIVLLFFTCLPLQYTTDFCIRLFPNIKRIYISLALNLGLFAFVLYCNRYYDFFYTLISGKLPFIFWLIADLLPLFLIFLPKEKSESTTKKEVNAR